jgi:hypothetical protein
MEFKLTKHQVARGSRPDADIFDKFYLIKTASELRATYQIRLLIYMAVEQGKKLIIKLRKDCKIHESLRELVKQYSKSVRIERE